MTEKERVVDSSNFIRNIIEEDISSNKNDGKVVTRFPPEPNGYLHIGHAKSICLNFGLAQRYNGKCHLRFDDTNPETEKVEYIEAIKEDVKWLGFDWGDNLFYASDYFDKLYELAIDLIKQGKAYVCSLEADQIRETRGTLTEPGIESPYRYRSVEENLELFERMRQGEFPEGSHVLRAKIDMASPNMNMRDPVIYRIKKVSHHRTGDKWCIYPMYDYTHCISDALEGITHSICTLEFEDHRPLYDWVLEQVDLGCHPQQIEFARLNLSYTVMSKRKLLRLVEGGYVSGWDDPRMPTIAGIRRRGYTPEAIRDFCERIGVAKNNSIVDIALLEHCVREDLNPKAPRVMGVLEPLKVVIENYPEGQVEMVEALNNPNDPDSGTRMVPFSREIYIERMIFAEDPPRSFIGCLQVKEVRLRYAYIVECTKVVKDEQTGEILEVHCTLIQRPGVGCSDGRKVRGTIHWVSAADCIDAEVRLYNNLFTKENPDEVEDEEGTFLDNINPESLVLKGV